ncbi:Has a role in transcriptional regulation [Tyrophagus putrescentiae]|nr:Has a role in transcriptional regulation [Tyrophagus putrescentiae]
MANNTTISSPPPGPQNSSSSNFPKLTISGRYQAQLNEGETLAMAKTLKREADKNKDRHQQMALYIEAVLYFIQTGIRIEEAARERSDVDAAIMYKETAVLLKATTNKFLKSGAGALLGGGKPFTASETAQDVKLTVLSYRVQAMLTLKLSRMRSKEMHENKELITAFMAEPSVQGALSHAAPSSASASSAQANVSMTPATLQAMAKQLTLLQNFQTAVELWCKSEAMIEKSPPAVREGFFGALAADRRVGGLQLSSTFEQLINYALNAVKNL